MLSAFFPPFCLRHHPPWPLHSSRAHTATPRQLLNQSQTGRDCMSESARSTPACHIRQDSLWQNGDQAVIVAHGPTPSHSDFQRDSPGPAGPAHVQCRQEREVGRLKASVFAIMDMFVASHAHAARSPRSGHCLCTADSLWPLACGKYVRTTIRSMSGIPPLSSPRARGQPVPSPLSLPARRVVRPRCPPAADRPARGLLPVCLS